MFKSIFKQLGLTFIILFVTTLVLLIIDLILGVRSHWSGNNMIFLPAIFIVNLILAIYSYPKNIVLPYLFLSATIIVEVLFLIVQR